MGRRLEGKVGWGQGHLRAAADNHYRHRSFLFLRFLSLFPTTVPSLLPPLPVFLYFPRSFFHATSLRSQTAHALTRKERLHRRRARNKECEPKADGDSKVGSRWAPNRSGPERPFRFVESSLTLHGEDGRNGQKRDAANARRVELGYLRSRF